MKAWFPLLKARILLAICMASCSLALGMATTPSSSPMSQSSGFTTTPPHCTGTCNSPAYSAPPALATIARANTGSRLRAISALSRMAPSITTPARPLRNAASVVSPPQSAVLHSP
jgi:hypothetical protein